MDKTQASTLIRQTLTGRKDLQEKIKTRQAEIYKGFKLNPQTLRKDLKALGMKFAAGFGKDIIRAAKEQSALTKKLT